MLPAVLYDNQAMCQALVESAPDAILVVEEDGRISFANAQAERLFAYPREELLGRPVELLLPEHARAAHTQHRRRYNSASQTRPMGVGLELYARRQDGAEIPVDIMLSPMDTAAGHAAIAIVRDITVRKRAETALQRQTTFVKLLQAAAVAANEATDLEEALRIILAQIGMHAGWPVGHIYLRATRPDEVLVPTSIWYLDDPDRFKVFRVVTEQTRFRPGDGWLGQILITRQPIWTADLTACRDSPRGRLIADLGVKAGFAFPVLIGSELVAVLEFFSDQAKQPDAPFLEVMAHIGTQLGRVAERQRYQLALERQAAQLCEHTTALKRSNQELEQFAYVASHDLQEPLRMVTSYVQLLQRRYQGQLDAKADMYIAYAVDGTARMQNLIQDLLAYSRVTKESADFALTDCAHVLQQVLANLAVTIADAHATITADRLPTLPANAHQLAQLLQNLISNAIKFHAAAPPRVHISATRRGAEWVFAVRDNGIGIDPQYADRIFVIFQRLHTRQEYPGTGIGLAICKRIVEYHGGQIWMESSPGEGTTFYFTLPDLEGKPDEQRSRAHAN